jgi:hypothetical protein
MTCGTPKAFHHWLAIVEIKSKGKLCCNYDGWNALDQWWDDTCDDLIGFGMNQQLNDMWHNLGLSMYMVFNRMQPFNYLGSPV